MRLDRLLTLYFFGPLSRQRRAKEGVRIPILMYHSISEHDEPGRHPYFQTNTRLDVFARHMQYLADNNYTVISLSDAVSLLSGSSLGTDHYPLATDAKHPSPVTEAPRYVVITFDDGYRDFHDNAWPILKKHGYTATMFLPTGFIGNERNALNGKACLTWSEVKALAADGAAFGAHTVSHVQLYTMDRQAISYELQGSKREIEDKLGKEVSHYSYAHAFPEQDQGFLNMYETSLREAGYRAAVSTRIGISGQGDNLYMLKRIPVNSYDDDSLLQAKLEGGYDWLAVPQRLWKEWKGRTS